MWKWNQKRWRLWRAISWGLVLAMLVQLLPMAALAEEARAHGRTASDVFNDVPAGSWYEAPVTYVYENGLFGGTAEGRFSPDGTMTRAMFVTVLGRMAGVDAARFDGVTAFNDVPAQEWYAPYVDWAATYGVTAGTSAATFSPHATISREQLAALFVNYFNTFEVSWQNDAQGEGTPKDVEAISDWAREAALVMWQAGILVGDGVHFSPQAKASRAEAAALCMRIHGIVEEWHDVPPGEALPEMPEVPMIPENPDGESTRYYEVQFAMGEGQGQATLPPTKTYPEGTLLEQLPTPYANGQIFLGWYYDKALTKRAAASDSLRQNSTLYAKMAPSDGVSVADTPAYQSFTDQGTDFSFQVKAESVQAVKEALKITQISANNALLNNLTITDSGGGLYTVTAPYQAGHTYKAVLDEASAVYFVTDGTVQPDSVDTLNFTTAKKDVLNLGLDEDLIFIAKNEISAMSDSLAGLFSVSVDSGGAIEHVADIGTFSYNGDKIKRIGDTVAIYEGKLPSARTLDDSKDKDATVVYAEITAIDGTRYSYRTADVKDVLFTPDVLPVAANADQDRVENQLTLSSRDLDFSADRYAAMGLSAETTVDVGDYVGLYSGEFGAPGGAVTGYVRITSVETQGDGVVLATAPATLEDIQASMDIYQTRREEITMQAEEIAAMEADIERQARESGFVEEAVNYLSAMAIETNGFSRLPEDSGITSVNVQGAENIDLTRSLLKKSKVEVTEKKVEAKIKLGSDALEHFEDGAGGMRAELTVSFEMEIAPDSDADNKIVISVESVFEQEVLLGINVSGGGIWKWAWIFPYLYDYQLNANFDVGTYTGVAVTATMATAGGDDEEDEEDGDDKDSGIFGFEWGSVLGGDKDDPYVNIGKQIEALMDQGNAFFGEDATGEGEDSAEEDEPIHSGLMAQYSEMMEGAEDSWIELVRKEIFSIEGGVDPFHILVFGISADFVVSANMYITLGMTFEYGNAKRYNYSLLLFHQQTTNETIDLETAHYEFVFYVMGTLGIRAGVELEIAVGLISLKLDSVGISAEAGAYAQLWGYFYYKLTWKEGDGKEQYYAGALHFEIGLYLEIKFKAQLFSSDKLTYQPTLYEEQWPLYTAGEQANVYDFNYDSDDSALTTYQLKTVRALSLPTALFSMRYLDLQSGELYGADAEDEAENPAVNYDDATESRFEILFTNPAFSYQPKTNTVTVTPGAHSVKEATEMTIIWKGGPLSFTSMPIVRTVTITWTDPQNARYIAFDSQGGSVVEMLSTTPGSAIRAPQAPTKQGYEFGGWYSDAACTQAFTVPSTMPDYAAPNRGVTVYAKWIPAMNSYRVDYYEEALNGKMVLSHSTTVKALTESAVAPDVTAPQGFVLNQKRSALAQNVAASGATVVPVYFNRATYNLTFSYGDGVDQTLYPNVVYSDTKYGASLTAPILHRGGYVFEGWQEGAVPQTMPARDLTYHATWQADEETPYRVECYIEDANEDAWYYASAVRAKGKTGAAVNPMDVLPTQAGLTLDRFTVDGKTVALGDDALTIKGDGSLVVKCYFNRARHSVTFDSDGGSAVAAQEVRDGGKIVAPQAPIKAGYVFDGWQCDGKAWDFEQRVSAPLTLTAQWKAAKDTVYTVETYEMDTEGHYPKKATVSNTYHGTTGAEATVMTDVPTGFRLDEAAEGAVLSGIVAADGSLVLKRYLAREQYQLTFADGFGKEESKRLYYGATVVPPSFQRTGYAFMGWDSDVALTMPAAATTYTAKWRGWTYRIAFDANLPQGVDAALDAMPVQTGLVYGIETPLNPTTYSLPGSGYAFVGWSSDPDASEADYNDAAAVSILPTQDGATVTLYAVWKQGAETTYCVRHHLMNVDGEGYLLDESRTQTFKQAVGAMTSAAPLSIEGFTAETFEQVEVTESGTVVDIRYSRNRYDLSWNFNGGSAEGDYSKGKCYYGAAITAPIPSKKGHAFGGWDQTVPQTMPARDCTFSAQWDGNSHPLTVNDAATASGTVTYGSLVTLQSGTKEGHTFDGWEVEQGNITINNNQFTMPDEAVTVTAKWRVNRYTVHFESNGGSPVASIEADYGTAITWPAPPTKSGYAFAGWKLDGKAYHDQPTTMPAFETAEVPLHAQWRLESYTITYQGATPEDGWHRTYSVESPTILLPQPQKTGYAFNGWTENGTPITEIAAGSTGNRTLVANWQANTYHILFEANAAGTEGSMPPMAVSYDASQRLTANGFVRDGYTFSGWNSRQDGTGTVYADQAEVRNLAPSGSVTLYAQWTPTTVTVNFVDHDGSLLQSTKVQQYSGVATPPSDPVRTGYTFSGWDRSQMDNFNEDTTITATYTANQYDFTIRVDSDWQVKGDKTPGTAKLNGATEGTFTYDSPMDFTVKSDEDYTANGFSVNGTYYSGTTFPANVAATADIVVHFARKAYKADASWYKVRSVGRSAYNNDSNFNIRVTWSDGLTTNHTVKMSKEDSEGANALWGVYPTEVYTYKNGGVNQWCANRSYVGDLSGNEVQIGHEETYWVSNLNYTWHTDGLIKRYNGTKIPLITLSGDALASIDLTTYGINGKLSGLTYSSDHPAVAVRDGMITIDASKLQTGETTIGIQATTGHTTPMTVTEITVSKNA